MDKIIVPIDFSKFSEYALETAAMLAKRNHSEILALHMLEMSEGFFTTSNKQQDAKTLFYIKLAEKKFKSFLKKKYLQGLSVIPIVKHYKVFREINQVAEDHSADIVVMGSHGTSEDSGYFTGSNTEKVVRYSNVPVLVVKNKPTNVEFKNVVFVNNFDDESIDAYKRARKLFKPWTAKIHLLYVNIPTLDFKNSDEMEAIVSEFLKIADGNLDHLNDVHYISDYSVEQGVFNFAKRVNADLISIPTHGRTGLNHIFNGSISEDIANHSTMPVLTFKI